MIGAQQRLARELACIGEIKYKEMIDV